MPARFPSGARFSREILSAEFDIGFETVRPHIAPLITEVTMGDGEGTEQKHIVTGNEAEPREMFGDAEHFDEIGDYTFSIRPVAYHGGLKAHDHDLADERIPVVQTKARSMGSKAAQFVEKKIIEDVVESATAVDGFDGEPLYSATHNWDTSDESPGEPASTFNTNQSNIFAGSLGAGVDYTGTSDVLDDFYGAMSRINSFVDDKGTSIHSGDGKYIILANNQTPSLMRFLRLAFVESTRPGDDTNRDGFDFNVELVFSPHLLTSDTNDNDWYLFKIPPGQMAPLVLQRRQDVQSEVWRDELTKMNYWDYSMRFGVSWTSWWTTVKVNNG